MKWDAEGTREIKRRRTRERMEKVRSKKLLGQFLMETDEKAMRTAGRSWLRTGYRKKETEGFLAAAQSQALGVNAIKAKMVKSRENLLCHLYHQKSDTVKHIVREWPKTAQKQ